MMKILRKLIQKTAVWACTVSLVCAGGFTLPQQAFGAVAGVVPQPTYDYDILLSVDKSLPYDKDELQAKILHYIKEEIGEDSTMGKDGAVRVDTGIHDIDTTDLSSWYVYDHYDVLNYLDEERALAALGDEFKTYPDLKARLTEKCKKNYPGRDENNKSVYLPRSYYEFLDRCMGSNWTDVFGPSTNKRPCQPVWERFDQTGGPVTLESKVESGLADFDHVAHLDRHIHSYKGDDGSAAMVFSGYGYGAFTDYLFYPAECEGTEFVSFTVDSTYVNTHSLNGAGFLINTGIDRHGVIKGYLLYYSLTGAKPNAKANKLTLYRLDEGLKAVDLSDLHNGPTTDMTKNAVKGMTKVFEKAISGTEWKSKMDVDLTITEDKVEVRQKATDSSGFNLIASWDLDSTGYRGFGPLVQYEGQGHTCNMNSMFLYSNLKMSFTEGLVNNAESLLANIKNSQFAKDSENKIFVNLVKEENTGGDGGYAVCNGTVNGASLKDKGIVQLLANKKIRIITNYNDDVDVAGGMFGTKLRYPTYYLDYNPDMVYSAMDPNAIYDINIGTEQYEIDHFKDNVVDLNRIDKNNYFGNGMETVARKVGSEAGCADIDELAKNIAAAIVGKSFDPDKVRPEEKMLTRAGGQSDVIQPSERGAASLRLVDEDGTDIAEIDAANIPAEGVKVYLDTSDNTMDGIDIDDIGVSPNTGPELEYDSGKGMYYFTVVRNLDWDGESLFMITVKNTEGTSALRGLTLKKGKILDEPMPAPPPVDPPEPEPEPDPQPQPSGGGGGGHSAPATPKEEPKPEPVENHRGNGYKDWQRVEIPASEDANLVLRLDEEGQYQPVAYSEVVNNQAIVLNKDTNGLKLTKVTGLFDDMKDHWAQESTDFTGGRKLFNGTDPGVFNPNKTVSRGMMATIVYRMEEEPEARQQETFTDVEGEMYYADPISWATDKGIVLGLTNELYGPEDDLTREQAAAILYRYAQRCGYLLEENSGNSWSAFPDRENTSPYAVSAMAWAIEKGIIKGDPNNALSPNANIKRSEASAMVERFIKAVLKK